MTLEEAIKRYTDNAEYERTHGNLQGCLDFRQLVELLKELKRWREFGRNNSQPCENCISRQAVLDKKELVELEDGQSFYCINPKDVETLPPVTPQPNKSENPTSWIPVSERLPKDLEPVNITWVNHDPESYYADIKDKPFTATGVYFNGQWYWWSALCTDILAEYSHNYDDVIDDDIEIIAWCEMPEPYKAESEDKK